MDMNIYIKTLDFLNSLNMGDNFYER